MFRGLYRDYLGPRTTDVLHASLLTLAGRSDATLCALPLLLSNDRYRHELTKGLEDDLALRPFWQWFDRLSAAERRIVTAPVMNKVRPFLLRKALRTVIGQAQPRFDVSEVFTRRKVLLVSLPKGVLGDTASLLGSLIVAQVWRAAASRVGLAPERRHPVLLYLDEFQDYFASADRPGRRARPSPGDGHGDCAPDTSTSAQLEPRFGLPSSPTPAPGSASALSTEDAGVIARRDRSARRQTSSRSAATRSTPRRRRRARPHRSASAGRAAAARPQATQPRSEP